MSKISGVIKLILASLVMFFQLKFIEFFYVDSCVDRGGRFLAHEMMCEGENVFISFNLSPTFYILTCVFFGVVILGAFKLLDRLAKRFLH